MKYSIDQARAELDAVSTEGPLLESMLNVAAIITKYMEEHTHQISDLPIIVGGLSMEIYTDSEYTTQDIDFVSTASFKLSDLLLDLGFEKEERVYIYDRLKIAVDIVDSVIEPPNYEGVRKIEIDDNKHVYSISIEDILYDRALDYERQDNEKYCIYLIANQYDDIDFDYIKRELKKADLDALEAFKKWCEIALEN